MIVFLLVQQYDITHAVQSKNASFTPTIITKLYPHSTDWSYTSVMTDHCSITSLIMSMAASTFNVHRYIETSHRFMQ